MKNCKRILGILLACLMLVVTMPMAVSAAGTKDDPIDASTKWFGYGVDTYLLNPTIAEGATDGTWYTLTASKAGILFVEHSYKNVDYTIYVYVGNAVYEGGCVDGVPYNRPIHTYPLAVGDVVTIQIVTKDAAAGTVYANMNIIENDVSNAIKVKSTNYPIYVAAGKTVYFQDDSLQAEYAIKDAVLSGDAMDGVTFYNVVNNTTTGTYTMTALNDTDGDGQIELTLGGSAGSAGAPAIKPAWAVENKSAVDKCFVLTLQTGAHECNWDDNADVDCNTCGAMRDGTASCNHVYSFDLDSTCDICNAEREIDLPASWGGMSISEDVNGLACLYEIQVEGLATNGTVALYQNATFCGMKLVGMGAVACNNFEDTGIHPTLEDADGEHVVDIPAQHLWDYDKATNTASFAVRVIDIPDHGKDTYVLFVPYVIVEDAQGEQYTLYITSSATGGTYNEAFARAIAM